MIDQELVNLLVAALAGLAVGFEREWSGHTRGPDARFGGIRTFALIATIGGLAGVLLTMGYVVASAVITSAALLFPIVAYVEVGRRPGTSADSTTEVAAILVAVVGLMAGLGHLAIASSVASIMVLLLAEKTQLQQWLARIDEHELRAALQFAVLALVVLPLLPDTPLGPYHAIRLRQLWSIVLLFSGLSFAGYLARRVVGNTRGYGVTGLLGGLVSSTAVAFDFSRKSRHIAPGTPSDTVPQGLGLGVVAACTMLLLRVVTMSAVLQASIVGALIPFLLPPFLVGSAMIAWILWHSKRTATITATTIPADGALANNTPNPLRLWSSIQMAVAFQLVLLAVAWMQERIGNTGVLSSAVLLGLTDMDALTLSMTRLAADNALVPLAALAIALGILSNTFLKLGVVVVMGRTAFRRVAGLGLALLAAASGIGLWIGLR